MASGDTNITICNQALNLLGADTISSFTDTTNDAATVCNNIYETVQKQTLSLYPWSFALTKQQLSNPKFDPVTDKKDRVQENLFTEGGEYYIKGTNKEYVGKYHIHPTKGAMVGAKHTRLPHDSLVRIDPTKMETTTQLDTGSQEFTPSVNISGGTGFTAGSSGGGGSSGY